MCALLSKGIVGASAQEIGIGAFDGQTSVDSRNGHGGASYDATKQTYAVANPVASDGPVSGQFQFLWKKMSGNFLLRTRLLPLMPSDPQDPQGNVGWIARLNLDAGGPFVAAALDRNGRATLSFRRAAEGRAEEIQLGVMNPDVLQFERHGSNYIFSAAHYGETFVSATLTNFELGDEVYAGLFVSRNTGFAFSDTRIVRPVKDGFTPYRDFIGSVLETLNVQTGESEELYRSAEPFEAPNWTRDGTALIYNVSGRAAGWGRLSHFDLATKTITNLNTGSCTNNNNDHVLSFDGTMLGISDQSASHGGRSQVFTLPSGGGTPKMITPTGPSYFHGWSPDATTLVFTGVRPLTPGSTNKYDVFKIPSDGSGTETRLTDAPGVNDGPEYTPDGSHIYFNSSRTGLMQIWRMDPDGKNQQQITDDDFNNWFPHISPDGKWIVFVSFNRDVAAGDHPYYKHIYLRLMPITGGKPKVIAYLYGGQGTMNVPSWSPDSTRIAFVSNSQ